MKMASYSLVTIDFALTQDSLFQQLIEIHSFES
jgi:hypothetical protein